MSEEYLADRGCEAATAQHRGGEAVPNEGRVVTLCRSSIGGVLYGEIGTYRAAPEVTVGETKTARILYSQSGRGYSQSSRARSFAYE